MHSDATTVTEYLASLPEDRRRAMKAVRTVIRANLPKGLVEAGEDELAAAKREFEEETGQRAPLGSYRALGEVKLKSGKRVVAFAARGDFDVTQLKSQVIEIEYPPRSGPALRIPEVDRAAWATLAQAQDLANPAQLPLIAAALAPQ